MSKIQDMRIKILLIKWPSRPVLISGVVVVKLAACGQESVSCCEQTGSGVEADDSTNCGGSKQCPIRTDARHCTTQTTLATVESRVHEANLKIRQLRVDRSVSGLQGYRIPVRHKLQLQLTSLRCADCTMRCLTAFACHLDVGSMRRGPIFASPNHVAAQCRTQVPSSNMILWIPNLAVILVNVDFEF